MNDKSPATVARIEAAALQLLASNPSASMTQIAAAAKVSKAALYYFYDNKAALLEAVICQRFDRFLYRIAQVSDDQKLTPRERLERIIELHAELVRDDRGFMHLTFQHIFNRDPKLLEAIRQRQKRKFELLCETISACDFTSISPPIAARMLLNQLNMTAMQAAICPNHPDNAKIFTALLKLWK